MKKPIIILFSFSGATGDAFGSISGSDIAGWFGQKEQNRENVRQQKDTEQFQLENANNAYQRAAEDLEKAGINPILAGKWGGAASPNVAFAEMGNKISSAFGVSKTIGETKKLGADTDKSKADTSLSKLGAALKQLDVKLKKLQMPGHELKERLYRASLKVADDYFGMTQEQKAEAGSYLAPLITKFPGWFSSNQISKSQKKAFDDIIKNKKPTKKSPGFRTR